MTGFIIICFTKSVLFAPSAYLDAGKHGLAKEGISYAGLRFDSSKDGTAQGTRKEEVVECWWARSSGSSADGETSSRLMFSVFVPPLSAVVLTAR